jgi:hypothetical protein
MKKLVMLVLLVFSSFNISNSTKVISDIKSKEFYYYEYKLLKHLSKVKQLTNKELGNTSNLKNLPISLPIIPDSNFRITSNYGKRQCHPILKTFTFHKGIDIASPKNTDIISTANGVVIRRSYDFMGYGKFIEIKHENNVSTIYAHLNKRLVDKGDTVEIGQVIGKLGNTGLSTGNHLHYEIRNNNISIDPETVIPFSINTNIKDVKFTNEFIKNVQMEKKEVTKKYTLSALKDLKEKLVNRITAREHNLKYGNPKKQSTLDNSMENIQIDIENLVRVKEVLAKANSIEFKTSEDTEEMTTNNAKIFKLSLLRDLKKTMAILKKNEKFELSCTQEIEKLDEQIKELNEALKKFNNNTTVEINLLEEKA